MGFPNYSFRCCHDGDLWKFGLDKTSWTKRKKEALEALEKVGMLAFKSRQISQLSGGQQQRIFLARALVQKAAIYFMDEPFQGVDASTEIAIINILKELRKAGKTVIVVHHDLQTVPNTLIGSPF
ncbi:metal ABC transporter ATP-binding protein [Lacinutrix neustonica]|uniref:metal ABC transporter ATP-binding protein n=1 Tax=Lacinutrix neustonica TaxID=2980107 RepID=UPI0036F362B7